MNQIEIEILRSIASKKILNIIEKFSQNTKHRNKMKAHAMTADDWNRNSKLKNIKQIKS